uniref:Uncharacterized protein n=1 Tax=Arundo donax TaxID=35708 RepID=A0A0A8XP26_ARUDO
MGGTAAASGEGGGEGEGMKKRWW